MPKNTASYPGCIVTVESGDGGIRELLKQIVRTNEKVVDINQQVLAMLVRPQFFVAEETSTAETGVSNADGSSCAKYTSP